MDVNNRKMTNHPPSPDISNNYFFVSFSNSIFARKAQGHSMGVLRCLQGLTYILFVRIYCNETNFNELNK